MKTTFKLVSLLFILTIISCADVIDVPVQNDSTRLVIEASLDWEKGTTGNAQTIKLRTSSPFFDTMTNTDVTGASVKVINNTNGSEFSFVDQNNGEYTTDAFVPLIGQSYSLEVLYNGEMYSATETLNAVPEVTDVYQTLEDGFDEELLEVHVIFTDPPEEGNNYFIKFQKEGELLPELEVGFDEFINGNEVDWWYEFEEEEEEEDENDEVQGFEAGDSVRIEMYAISEPYKDYIEILTNQLGGVGLFDTTPVLVKGNCINVTNSSNYAHGYFRVTEKNTINYTFE